MTLLQIQYAISCFHTGSISKAAQENYTSVANLSKALKALESELNYALFFRSHSGLVPTKISYNPPSSNPAVQLDFSHYRYFDLDAINPDKLIVG